MNDNIKNEYCKVHKIKLLRINYKDFRNIKKIIKENIF
jgi:ribosomal protein S18